MASRNTLLTTFEPDRIIQPIYTGGDVALDGEARLLATCLGEEALLTDLESGRTLTRLEGVGMRSGVAHGELADNSLGWRSPHRPSQSVRSKAWGHRVITLAHCGYSHTVGISSDTMFSLALHARILSTAI